MFDIVLIYNKFGGKSFEGKWFPLVPKESSVQENGIIPGREFVLKKLASEKIQITNNINNIVQRDASNHCQGRQGVLIKTKFLRRR